MNVKNGVLRVAAMVLLALVLVSLGAFVQDPTEPALPVPELLVGAIALAPIIVALVGAAKALGMPTKYAPLLNGLLSLAGYGLVILVGLAPDKLNLITYILEALVVFLSAAGFYDRFQAATRKPKFGAPAVKKTR